MYNPEGYSTKQEQRLLSRQLHSNGFRIPEIAKKLAMDSTIDILRNSKAPFALKSIATRNLIMMEGINVKIDALTIPQVHINVNQIDDAQLNDEIVSLLSELNVKSIEDLKEKCRADE